MKTDKDLGRKVNQLLINKGIETPTTPIQTVRKEDTLVYMVSERVKEIMTILGLDLTDDSMQDTPTRVAEMWVKELFSGLDYDQFPKCTAVENKFGYDEMICETGIKVMSVCEHHWQTIHGKATIAYIPETKSLGFQR